MRARISIATALLVVVASLVMPATARAAGEADLAVTVDAPSTAYEGAEFTVFVTIINRGPAASSASTLSLTFSGTSGPESGYGCAEQPGTRVCPIGSMPAGSALPMSFRISRADTVGTITFTAELTSNQADPDLANNRSRDTTEVVVGGPADLFARAFLPGNLTEGEQSNFFLNLGNDGPATAHTVTYTVTVSPNLEIVGSTPGCSTTSTTIVCRYASYHSRTAGLVEIRLRAVSQGTAILTASIDSADNPDPDTSDNSASASATVSPRQTDLSVSVQAPASLSHGQTGQVSIGFQNNGPLSAPNTVLTTTVADGLEIVSADGCETGSTTVTCRLGELQPNTASVVSVQVRATAPGTATTRAEITSDRPDSNPGNNTATATTRVDPAVDLRVAVSESSDPVKAKRDLVLTSTVTNAGPSTSTSTSLRHDLSFDGLQGFTIVSVTPSQGTCSTTAGTVTCDLGSLGASAAATVAVTVRPRSGGMLTSRVGVSAAEADNAPADNSVTEVTRVSTSGH